MPWYIWLFFVIGGSAWAINSALHNYWKGKEKMNEYTHHKNKR